MYALMDTISMIRTRCVPGRPAPAPTKPPDAHVSDQAAAMIPAELRDARIWLVWGYHLEGEKWKKPPIVPETGELLANWSDPANCLTFEEARRLAREHGDGIGILVGKDL